MRITNSMMSSSLLNNLNRNLGRLDKYQQQLASQKRLTRLSDDPVSVISIMEMRNKIFQLDKYQSSVDSARSWLQTTESAMSDVNEQLKTTLELTTQMAKDTYTDDDKKAAAEKVKQMMDHLVQTGNSTYTDQYIFGGYNTSTKPFEVDDVTGALMYNGIEIWPNATDTVGITAAEGEKIQYEVGYGLTTDVNFTGVKLMGVGDNNLYGKLANLYKDLTSDAPAKDIGEHIKGLQDSQADILAQMAELGGRDNRLEMITNRYEQETLNYTTRLSAVEDIDLAETYLGFSTASAVYSAALQTGAKIIQPTLMDYIR